MILGLFRRPRDPAATGALYAAIVARSRQPVFYTAFGVPDTVEGRFDMIVLHLALLCRRLAREGEQALAQGVFDTFCRDMDHNLREMGVGDLAVPRRMRGFAEAFYGRLEAYDRALTDGGAGLAQALARNVLGTVDVSAGADRLAVYARSVAGGLDTQPVADFRRGIVTFPDPDRVADEGQTP